MDKKFVYLFSEGNAQMRELLGGKGANLAAGEGKKLSPVMYVLVAVCLLYFYTII